MLNRKCTSVRSWLLTILATTLVGTGAWGQTFKVLHAFGNGGDGTYPEYGLVLDGQGNLYGVSPYGPLGGCGGDGCGTAYQLKPNSDGIWTETVIHDFSDSGGTFPSSALILDSQGNLYGSAWGQGHYPDVVYQLTPGSGGAWIESALYQFPGSSFGSDPGELTFDAVGNIYGTTRFGGVNGTGTVFSLNRSSAWQESLLLTFDGYSGDHEAEPFGAITFDANGNLYGTTLDGGVHGAGVVYKLTNQGGVWRETVLYNFTGGSDGNAPWGVTFGPDGSLYGVTQVGGNTGDSCFVTGCGTVFKLTPNPDGTWTETLLYAFRGLAQHDGETPTEGIAFDRAGNIYGTTANGGIGSPCTFCGRCPYYGCGTVFKLTPSSGGQWTESILHFFTGGSDGLNPDSTPAIDGAGNLYGTAPDGGLYGYGVAYEITP